MTAGRRYSSGPRSAPGDPGGPPEQNAGWAIFSYLLSGMAVYGLVGWLVARLTQLPVLFPVGMLAGLVLAIVLIVLKYGRP